MARREQWRSLREHCDVRMPDDLARLLARHNVTPAQYRDLEAWCGEGNFDRIYEVVKRSVGYDHRTAEWEASR
ncbi:hypothetical protein [Nocardioides sp. BYT-33-1]|uniref:hypothetical protein n=1 Tax=Nocardioides sp. BYT-33-1 TaxID=3416952 RepID=UPI003F52FCB0